MNEDTIAYLNVSGTNIDTTVVKCNNNDFYLNHNYRKKKNISGWIFVDYRNKMDGSDKNIVIYGHNMKNGKMFSELKTLLNKDWKKNPENRYITLITEKEKSIYEIFSVYEIESEEGITTHFSSGEFKRYANSLKEKSIYDFDIKVEENDKIITLSTCGRTNKFRILLHAKKIA